MIRRFGIDVVDAHDYKRCHDYLKTGIFCCGLGAGTAAAGLALCLVGADRAAASLIIASVALLPCGSYLERRFRKAVAA